MSCAEKVAQVVHRVTQVELKKSGHIKNCAKKICIHKQGTSNEERMLVKAIMKTNYNSKNKRLVPVFLE